MATNPAKPKRSRQLATAVAILVGLVGVVGIVSSATSAATAPCTVTYSVDKQNRRHFQASIQITNNAEPVDAWALEFTIGDHYIRQGWNAQFTQSGSSVTMANDSDNGQLKTGQSVTAQFRARSRGTVSPPTSFTLNGQTCDDGTNTLVVSLTTAAPATTTTPTTTTVTTESTDTDSTESPDTTAESSATTAQPTTTEPATTTSESTATTMDHGTSAEANLKLIKANPTRNTDFDDNSYRNVAMDDIPLSALTVAGDIYNEGLLNTANSGYFRVKCEVSHFAYDDPIVHPGQPGRAHLHMFFGNTDTNAYSTYDSLMNTGTGTCNGEDLNRSAYWIPAVLDGNGDALIPFEVMVYYKNDNFRLDGANELVAPFPENLQMIAGRGSATEPQGDLTGGPDTLPVVSFSCGPAYKGMTGQPLIPDCTGTGNGPWSGRALEMKVAFPQCHNPNNGTYAPDGSHMTYSEYGYYGAKCPDSHPADMSSIMYRIFFDPDQYGGSLTDLHLSSDIKADQILPGGTTAHADWFGAWHPEAMARWVENCNNTRADCETGLLDRDPAVSMVKRKTGFYPSGYRAQAEDLIKLCPDKELDPANRLRSVASCHHHR